MKIKKLLFTLIFTTFLLFTSSYSLSADTGIRKVTHMGCHVHDHLCFVTLEGAQFGTEFECASNQARWSADSASGDRHFSLITAAWMSGKKVSLNITGCLAGFPTFNWANYHD